MTTKDINDIYNRVDKYIAERRMKDAFALMKNTAESAMLWEYSDEISAIERNYRYMLDYMLCGAEDPNRDTIYGGLVADTYTVLDKLKRMFLERDTPTLYYNVVRYVKLNHLRLETLVERYYEELNVSDNIVAAMLTEEHAEPTEKKSRSRKKDKATTRRLEGIERDIFNYMWTVFPLTRSDKELALNFLLGTVATSQCKVMMVSGVMMGILEFYDDEKLDLLMSVYDQSEDVKLTAIALIGILITLYKYRYRGLTTRAKNHLEALKDREDWIPNLKIAYIELIRTRDTERIAKTMREEILPDISGLQTDIFGKLEKGDFTANNLESISYNPEWEKMLDKSGIADKIKKMNELQAEGADVFMSTFCNLKSFPFFNDIANWFVPFNMEHSELIDADEAWAEMLGQFVQSLPYLCDSDKYSFMLSLCMIPGGKQGQMYHEFKKYKTVAYEAMMEMEGQKNDAMRSAINSFLQNAYRFFKLFRRKGEFFDPFKDGGTNLLKVECLDEDFTDEEMLSTISEFYFAREYWDDALYGFNKLNKLSVLSSQNFEKIGFCYEHLEDYDKALEYYHQAEFFEPDNNWLINRLAKCYRKKKDYKQAFSYLKKIVDQDPTVVDNCLALGYCYLALEEYEDAITQFYSVEYNSPDPKVGWRPLAWALFLNGEYESSLSYYDKLLSDSPTGTDYLNAGHAYLASKQVRDAVVCYMKSIARSKLTVDSFLEMMKKDMSYLEKVGVTKSEVSLIIDSILYSI